MRTDFADSPPIVVYPVDDKRKHHNHVRVTTIVFSTSKTLDSINERPNRAA